MNIPYEGFNLIRRADAEIETLIADRDEYADKMETAENLGLDDKASEYQALAFQCHREAVQIQSSAKMAAKILRSQATLN